jgi:hypothetical protein
VKKNVAIVVMQNRFVSVGVLEQQDGWLILDNAQVVRRWGTTRGLGEIAENGPTKDTKLDPTPRQRIPLHTVIKVIDCVEKKWKAALSL